MIEQALAYVQAHLDEFLDGYKELLRIPSISTDPAYKEELLRCAAWVVAEMERIGLNNCRTLPTAGHPVVYGEWLEAGPDKPTVLVYAHYDVQPVDPLSLWESAPFEPTVREGKLFARGAIDDKSGVWGNLKAFEAMFAADGKLPVNIKVCFEGEEEMASPNMHAFVAANKELLAADAVLLCDGGFKPERPSITYALRGALAAEVTIRGPKKDLHSGAYGGVVHNPLHLAGKIVGSFHDETGRIQIPGYYDAVRALSESESAAMHDNWEQIKDRVMEGSTVDKLWAEPMGTPPERITALPTLDVNGISGGYEGPGIKTIIPSSATFKVTMRLVADQDPEVIAGLFTDHVMSFATDTLDIDVQILAKGWPVTMEFEGPLINAVQTALKATTGLEANLTRGGGSIPIGGMFQQELGAPLTALGVGFGENVHSPNEYLELEHFQTGIDTLLHFYYAYGE
ncbi:MAG: dipeptidase [Anaerolineales bacterium]|nr:dipeptidase [Anaerolineales bacterium]